MAQGRHLLLQAQQGGSNKVVVQWSLAAQGHAVVQGRHVLLIMLSTLLGSTLRDVAGRCGTLRDV